MATIPAKRFRIATSRLSSERPTSKVIEAPGTLIPIMATDAVIQLPQPSTAEPSASQPSFRW